MISRLLRAIVMGMAVGIGIAVVCALVLSSLDMYLAGHGHATLGRPWIDRPLLHLSRADVILLCCGLGAAVPAAWASAKKRY
jgi:hypothetical protein